MIEYRTIRTAASHEIVIKKSRFICNISQAFTKKEAEDFISKISKQHYKATHNCVAYQIGNHNEEQKAIDNGEPSGTAGIPMLEVLKQNDLKNVVCVVTRYFGGIKLGTGGSSALTATLLTKQSNLSASSSAVSVFLSPSKSTTL